MSGSDQDDPLGGLLSSTLQRKKRPDSPATEPGSAQGQPDSSRGLNPLDLLSLPRAQRDLVNFLSRQKQARFEEIQNALRVDAAQLNALLSEMKQAGYIHEALIDGGVYYRVVFRGKVSRAGRTLPDTIWQRVDLDNTLFLQQMPLFRGLSREQLVEIANLLEARRYHRNEVIIWQGGVGDGVYLIKNGVVGITRLSPQAHETQTLAYLKQGDLLGESGLLAEQTVATNTTATALSEVDVLVMKHQDFLHLLETYPSVAIELLRILTQRLLATHARVGSSGQDTKLCLVLGTEAGVGVTTIGSALASSLVKATRSPTVYTEHPLPQRLPTEFGFPADLPAYTHPDGYEIVVPQDVAGLPATVRATLVLDRLVSNYANIVISLTGEIDEPVIYMLERAEQVVLVAPPGDEATAQLNRLYTRLKALTHPEKTSVFVVCNRPMPRHTGQPVSARIDFDIPFLDTLPSLAQRRTDNLPEALAGATAIMADRLGRTNQIGLYIPTTVDVNQVVDTNSYIDETLAFLGRLFGGATSNPAQGVWNSDEVGLVSEAIYIVRTYVTKSDLDRHLGEVLTFVERLKSELNQEAMALEVNHKLMLI